MSGYQVDRNKWHKLSLLEQMGNIGSEVGRTYIAVRQHDLDKKAAASARAIDLFMATTEDRRHTPAEHKEILRAKEVFLRSTLEDDATDQAAIENYFNQFALAARNTR